MPDYQNGKIYAIRSYKTEDIYIGSTIKKYLSRRLAQHKATYKHFLNTNKRYTTSFKIIELGDAYIELLENYPCNSKNELTQQEGEYIRNTKNCINKCMKYTTEEEWRKANYNILLEKRHKYIKKYNEKNKEIINKKKTEKIECECGVFVCRAAIARHRKTNKHKLLMG